MSPTPLTNGFDDVSSSGSLDFPESSRPMWVGGSFIVHNGPLYGHWNGQSLLLEFRVEERHSNPLKVCHGGKPATFADMLIPCASMYPNEMG